MKHLILAPAALTTAHPVAFAWTWGLEAVAVIAVSAVIFALRLRSRRGN